MAIQSKILDVNDQKLPKIDQLFFLYIYVVGEDDQQNAKVGQNDQLSKIVGQESLHPPPSLAPTRGCQGSPAHAVIFNLPILMSTIVFLGK